MLYRGVIHFRMLLQKPQRQALRRRLTQLSVLQLTALGGVAAYALASAEPSLTGLWVREPQGTLLRLTHIGDTLTADFTDGSDGVSFRASATSKYVFQGEVMMTPLEHCGERYMQSGYRIIFNGGELHEFYSGKFGDPDTCEVWRDTSENTVLRRATPADWRQ